MRAEDTARVGLTLTNLSITHSSYASAVDARPEMGPVEGGAARTHARELRRNLPKMEVATGRRRRSRPAAPPIAASAAASPRCRARERCPCSAADRCATRRAAGFAAGRGRRFPVPSTRGGGRRSSQRVCRHGAAGALVSGVIPIEERFPRPSVMGVVNVTPDSFSDGGLHLDPDVAAQAARRMVEEGAAIVDVGGESTRPGSEGVSAGEELRRVVPVLDRLGGELPVSIDTSKAAVARVALERGAILVNDVTALRGDPELAGVVAGAGAYLCLMHMQGEPRTMQAEPQYGDVAVEVASFLEERLAFAVAQGIPEERVCLDPGIGFGKTVAQNLQLVRRLDVLLALGRPVLVGFSRKSSLRKLTGSDDLLGASVAAAVAAFERGATILRVHDVRPHVDALTVAGAIA